MTLLLATVLCHVHSLQNALTIDEINRYATILQESKSKTLEESFHVVKALKALGKEVPAVEVHTFLLNYFL